MNSLLAQGTPVGNLLEGIGPLGSRTTSTTAFATSTAFTKIISITIGVLTISAGLWFIVQVFTGAIAWLGSGGDKQGVQGAQKKITNAIIGLAVIVLSYALISIVGTVLGLNILDFFSVFNTLTP